MFSKSSMFSSQLRFFTSRFVSFKQHWLAYLPLFLGVNFLCNLILLPLLRSLVGLVMRWSGIPYISYNNLLSILTEHFWGALGLVFLLVLLLLFVFIQFVLQFVGFQQISSGKASFAGILAASAQAIRQSWLKILPFAFFYFLLILPLAKFAFYSSFLANIQPPQSLMDIFYSGPLLIVLIVVYVLPYYFGLRLIYVLPQVILAGQPVRQAIGICWQKTRKFSELWRIALSLAINGLFVFVLVQVSFYSLYGLQNYFDQHSPLAETAAVVSMTLLQIILTLANLWINYYFVSFLIQSGGMESALAPAKPVNRFWEKVALGLPAGLLLILMILESYTFMTTAPEVKPVVISHRGVDNGNGAQNTIPALLATAKEEPDYVEMDVQETADQQFVVFHDPNLKNLTGRDAIPQKLTLSELTNLQVKENGQSAPLASFDAFLAAAENISQKLLIEIKTSTYDSKDMLANFVKRYGERIVADRSMIQSLDYSVITGIKTLDPKMAVSFILPINVAFPEGLSDALTMENTSLNQEFVSAAASRKQKVFAWTLNSEAEMRKAMFNQVNGIITDRARLLQAQIRRYETEPTHASRFYFYFANDPLIQAD